MDQLTMYQPQASSKGQQVELAERTHGRTGSRYRTAAVIFALGLLLVYPYYSWRSPIDCQCVVGIDLGTAYSSVAVYINGQATVIPNDLGNLRTPSYIAFNRNGEPFVGDEAKNYLTTDPQSVVFDVMRFLGRKHNDSFMQSQERFYPFKTTSDIQGGVRLKVKVGDKYVAFAPELLLALILKKMKGIAESYLKRSVDCAVVSVPAVFVQAQRHAVKDAGMIAGIRILKLPNTPSIATLAYSKNTRTLFSSSDYIVFYLGAGSCQVSLVSVSSFVLVHVRVSATQGTRDIGSSDFIHSVMQHYLDILDDKGANIRRNSLTVQKLRREVERALLRVYIQGASKTTIEVENDMGQSLLKEEVTRQMLDSLTMDLVEKMHSYITSMRKMAFHLGMNVRNILLFGGGIRVGRVNSIIKSRFKDMNVIDGDDLPERAKVVGAALHSAVIQKQVYSPTLTDVSTYGIGHVLKVLNNTFIEKYTPLPFRKSEVYSTAKTGQTNMASTYYEVDTPVKGQNTTIYSLILDGLSDRAALVLRIVIDYELSDDGLFQLDARETGNRKTVTLLRPENTLPEPDMKDILVKWNGLIRKWDNNIRRGYWQTALSKCTYSMLHFVRNSSSIGKKTSDSVNRILKGCMKWQSRSGGLDPLNFKDRLISLNKNLRVKHIMSEAYNVLKYC